MSSADQLELNKGDNFIFLVDVSASMQTQDCPGNTRRIDYLKEQTIVFATEASKWDEDGIDVITFGAKLTPYKGVSADTARNTISALQANEGMTATGAAIELAYKMHKSGNYAQTVCFVCTDGAPSDPGNVKDVIRTIAADIKDEHEFAISFLTVGEIDSKLRDFLNELDDNLKAKFDIVDVKALDQVDFMAAFAGALHD